MTPTDIVKWHVILYYILLLACARWLPLMMMMMMMMMCVQTKNNFGNIGSEELCALYGFVVDHAG